ncbi:unnamed protein product, partial [Tuber aestivum]
TLYSTYALRGAPSNARLFSRALEDWSTEKQGRADGVISGCLERKLAQVET